MLVQAETYLSLLVRLQYQAGRRDCVTQLVGELSAGNFIQALLVVSDAILVDSTTLS